MKKHSLLLLFFAGLNLACGDMQGDTLKQKDGENGGNNPGQSAVLFSCEAASCFSGTQYCTKNIANSGQITLAECLNFPADCQSRDCVLNQTRSHYAAGGACKSWLEYHQDDSKVTVICRSLPSSR